MSQNLSNVPNVMEKEPTYDEKISVLKNFDSDRNPKIWEERYRTFREYPTVWSYFLDNNIAHAIVVYNTSLNPHISYEDEVNASKLKGERVFPLTYDEFGSVPERLDSAYKKIAMIEALRNRLVAKI